MANEFIARLAVIDPGHAITFRFDGRIVGRDTYLRINAAAHRVFGPRGYKITKPRGSSAIRVLRFPDKAAIERPRRELGRG